MSSDPAPAQPGHGDGARGPAPAVGDLDRLRQLLLQRDRDRLAALATRLDDPALRAAETASVLPEAVRLSVAGGPGLSATIAPVVEEAIHASVRRDPARLVDAIFPVIGPAIRRAIAATLREMVQSLNDLLESSVSWRGLMWRLEARRTGKPFAEVALLHTLVYQVEQVFLVHAETGLLLQHVEAASARSADPRVVSGMLTAIQDFVNESFNARGHAGTLDTMSVGDLTVWIEPGPRAYLAAVVRGHAPASLRPSLQDALARVHATHARQLDRFQGDAAPFAACRPLLEPCLQSKAVDRRARGASLRFAVVLTVVVAAFGYWAFQAWRASRQWNGYLEQLRAEPGIVVLAADRGWGRPAVSGLRDPLAADPAVLQAAAGYGAGEITSRWEPYQAADPPFVLARAATLLTPPATAVLTFAGGALTLSGTAPRAWIAGRLPLAPFVPGVTAVHSDGLRSQERVEAEARATTLARHRILFGVGRAVPARAQQEVLAALAADLRALLDAAGPADVAVAVEVVGGADETGSETANVRLGERRAEAVVAALVGRGFERGLFTTAVARLTADVSADETQRTLRRRVEFRARLIPAVGEPESGR